MKLESFLLIASDLYPNWMERRRKIKDFIMACESDLNIKKHFRIVKQSVNIN